MGLLIDREKTVFILGAGFSIPAGCPSQARIIEGILGLPNSVEKQAFLDFLKDVLNINPSQVSLEDIYTPIDRCLADGLSLRGLSAADLGLLRVRINYLIALAIKEVLTAAGPSSGKYIQDIATYLVRKASRRAALAEKVSSASEAKAYDPFSVISLNWDILLDNALNSALADDHPSSGDYEPFGVVDYCCNISSLYANAPRIRSGLWSLGCRGYNIKLLKLHGSMNWLQCPNCQRLYVEFDKKTVIDNHSLGAQCRHCEKHDQKGVLRGAMVMPTFLKDLSNFQIKLIWQNAAIELMEARQIVFVGYSLPQADFELRQLLSRTVHANAKIRAYAWKGSKPEEIAEFEGSSKRYKDFFSNHNVEIDEMGTLKFEKDLTA